MGSNITFFSETFCKNIYEVLQLTTFSNLCKFCDIKTQLSCGFLTDFKNEDLWEAQWVFIHFNTQNNCIFFKVLQMQLYKIGVDKEIHCMHFKVACNLFFEGLTGAFSLPRWLPFRQQVTYQLHVDLTSYLTKSKFCTLVNQPSSTLV